MVKNKTCFKNIENPSCVDLTITDTPGSFEHTDVFETGISDHHKLVTTVLKAIYKGFAQVCSLLQLQKF